jgi:purine-nucleoside phosphorylase
MEDEAREVARRAAAEVARLSGVVHHDVAVVLGSGWAQGVDRLGDVVAEVDVAELDGFSTVGVAGHAGTVRSIAVGRGRVLAFLGRTHLYEQRDPAAVAHPIRVAASCGCSIAILTNACGAINESFTPGQIVLVSDHINMTAVSPLVGAEFVDLSDLYSSRLRGVCRQYDPTLVEGVYVGYWGPNYETPAEIRAYRTLGGDLVGMSTVLEAIAARAAGMEVLGLSLVTNMAAGLAGPLSHEEVLERGRKASERAGSLVADLVGRLL